MRGAWVVSCALVCPYGKEGRAEMDSTEDELVDDDDCIDDDEWYCGE